VGWVDEECAYGILISESACVQNQGEGKKKALFWQKRRLITHLHTRDIYNLGGEASRNFFSLESPGRPNLLNIEEGKGIFPRGVIILNPRHKNIIEGNLAGMEDV